MADPDDVPTSIRIPRELMDRVDAVAVRLVDSPAVAAVTGGRVTRSAVIRRALELGVNALEAHVSAPPNLSGVLDELDVLRTRVEALSTASALFAPLEPPRRSSLEPCNVIRPSVHGYCQCGHALAAHIAVYDANGELVPIHGGS